LQKKQKKNKVPPFSFEVDVLDNKKSSTVAFILLAF